MAACVGNSGAVYSFEPVHDTYEVLSLNAKMAQLSSYNILPFCKAVSNIKGELSITRNAHSTLHQVSAINCESDQVLERTDAVTLAMAINELEYDGLIALVKIDVEGHELAVIEGVLPLLKARRIQRMIIEVQPGNSAEAIENILLEQGATLKTWIKDKWCDLKMSDLPYRTDIFVNFN
jgi:FkbM family methyltransferase